MVSTGLPAATTRTTSFKGSSPSSKYVKLNVGGALYYTTMQTLTKQDTMLKAMFSGRMEVLTDSEGKLHPCPVCLTSRGRDRPGGCGPTLTPLSPPHPGWILIDRCGKHFGTVLNYLRDGAVPLPDSRRETEELLAEAKYYLVQGLADECQAALQVHSPSTPTPLWDRPPGLVPRGRRSCCARISLTVSLEVPVSVFSRTKTPTSRSVKFPW